MIKTRKDGNGSCVGDDCSHFFRARGESSGVLQLSLVARRTCLLYTSDAADD